MSIHILNWIKEDFKLQEKNLSDFTIFELRETIKTYHKQYIKENL